MNKYCKGCFTMRNEDGSERFCGNHVNNGKGECPCTNCLIKPMCNSACDDYDKFDSDIRYPSEYLRRHKEYE